MKKKTKIIGDKKVIILSGEITGADAIALHKMMEQVRKEKCNEIVVDLRGVEYMDSNCLGALIYSRAVLHRHDKKLVLSAPHGFVEHLFRDCSFDRIFEIRESYE